MTKLEAIKAMEEGKKVTHMYFDKDEWISIQNGKILTEEGYLHDQNEFWGYRTNECFNNDWSIYNI